MKRLILFLTICVQFLNNSFCQTSTFYCYDPSWDWTKDSNWQIYFSKNLKSDGTYQGEKHYPFDASGLTNDLRKILENNDLAPVNG
jgi:hypothetical protein